MSPLPSGQSVKVVLEESIAVVTIDRPPVNALNRQTMEELDKCFEEIKKENSVKAVIITGGGSFAFIAGADVKEIAQLSSAQEAQSIASLGQSVITKIQKLGKPVIAAINGVCLGGGNELAMACHIRIAGDRVRFGQPEINLGIIPGFGGTIRLPRIIGKAKATELILTGDMISAQEAYRLGLINQVVPQDQVIKTAKDMARKIASKGMVAIKLALQVIEEGIEQPLEQALTNEAKAFGQASDTEDKKEGLKAFLEKRQPKFTDK